MLIRVRVNSKLLRRFKLIWVVQSPSKKYFAFAVGQINSTDSRVLTHKRGASRSSRTLGAGCDGRGNSQDERCYPRTAKPCGPDAPTLASSWQAMTCRRRWQKSPVTGESAEETVKTIVQGRSGQSGEPVVTTLVCYLLFRTRGCGCNGHPAFPAPSVFLGEWSVEQLGRFAPRECGRTPMDRLFEILIGH